MTEKSYVCRHCPSPCHLTTDKTPIACIEDLVLADWRIESEDETRAREQVEAIKYMDMDREHRTKPHKQDPI